MEKRFILCCFALVYAIIGMAKGKAYNFTNQVTFTKSGSGEITRFIGIMPVPQSDEYQTVRNFTYSHGNIMEDANYGNNISHILNSFFGAKILIRSGKNRIPSKIFGFSLGYSYLCGDNIKKENMARPIKETPILYGKDAERFVKEMERVEAMSHEERKANGDKVRRGFTEFCKRVTICL